MRFEVDPYTVSSNFRGPDVTWKIFDNYQQEYLPEIYHLKILADEDCDIMNLGEEQDQ